MLCWRRKTIVQTRQTIGERIRTTVGTRSGTFWKLLSEVRRRPSAWRIHVVLAKTWEYKFLFYSISFRYKWITLLKNLDGDIKGEDSNGKQLTVASVYRFITSSKIVPRVRHDKLAYKFVLSKKNILVRPEASTCFHKFSFPITSSQQEINMLWLSASTEAERSYHKM